MKKKKGKKQMNNTTTPSTGAPAVITASSGKAAEVKQFAGVFTCLLEHEVTKTKATFNWTGPKIKPELWAQVMEFFEWTYATEKSEAQVRLYVHRQHGWVAWAFPQEGGTGMTSKELPMDAPECIEQRKQFLPEEGWLYWGTVHHHCSASAFQSGVDEHNESSQEGIHITVGYMDKAMRDLHFRMYLGKHKFEPMMEHFWQLDDALLAKAEDMFQTFGIRPDLNKAARICMSQNSTALYNLCNPIWVPVAGETLFPPQWKENYRVKRWQPTHQVSLPVGNGHGGVTRGVYNLTGKEWCRKCNDWMQHTTENCPFHAKSEQPMSKKELRRLRYKHSKNIPANAELVTVKDAKSQRASMLLDALEEQAAIMGFPEKDFLQVIEGLAQGNNGALMELIVSEISKEKLVPEDLLMVILEREIKEEMLEKERALNAPSGVQEQQRQLNEGRQGNWNGDDWSGYGCT